MTILTIYSNISVVIRFTFLSYLCPWTTQLACWNVFLIIRNPSFSPQRKNSTCFCVPQSVMQIFFTPTYMHLISPKALGNLYDRVWHRRFCPSFVREIGYVHYTISLIFFSLIFFLWFYIETKHFSPNVHSLQCTFMVDDYWKRLLCEQ